MLSISPKQYSAFSAGEINRFLDRVIAFLREHFEDERSLSDEEQRMKLKPLVNKAQGYGMTTEQQVVGYILAAKHLGSDFDVTVPDAAAILTHDRLNGDEKLERLEQLIK
jgi:hypothetical protein